MESFAEKFAALRRSRELTQEEVAEHFGVSAQAVSKWENGESLRPIWIPTKAPTIMMSTTMTWTV